MVTMNAGVRIKVEVAGYDLVLHVGLGPQNEVSFLSIEPCQCFESDIGLVHRVDGIADDINLIKDLAIVFATVTDLYEGWYAPTQVYERVHLDGTLAILAQGLHRCDSPGSRLPGKAKTR